MHIVLSSATCSSNEYLNVQKLKHKNKLNPSQKYFDMLVKGFSENEDVSVTCISNRAIASSTSYKKFLKSKSDMSGNIIYKYFPIVNFFLVRNLINVVLSFVYTFAEILKKKIDNAVLVGDPLVYDSTFGSIVAAKFLGVKTCAVVTDLPVYMGMILKDGKSVGLKKKVRSFLMTSLISLFDSYVFLTESMNIINKKKKPFVLVEGMTYARNEIKRKNVDNNVVLYAGGLFEQFGIKNLVDAAKMVDVPGFELHLYGEGLCVGFINDVNKQFPNIKYMGSLSLDKIVEVESSAKILINPRPSSEEFTEYSFPSKTIEYMSTGRPVLTTPLKGIPQEYFEYLWKIDDESVKGISRSLTSLLRVDNSVLEDKALQGQKFVFEQKNNVASAKNVLDMIAVMK